MGTFVIKRTSISNSAIIADGSGPSGLWPTAWMVDPYPQTITDIMSNPFGSPGTWAIGWVDIHSSGSFTDTIDYSFAGSSIYLDGSLTPVDLAGLPAGFRPTSAYIYGGAEVITITPGVYSHFWLRLGNTEGPIDTPYMEYSSPIPLMSTILNGGAGLRVLLVYDGGMNQAYLQSPSLNDISGTYEIGGLWWLDPDTDILKFQAANPGGNFVEIPTPTVRTYGEENPVQGVSTGGTPIIIEGDGFADTAAVTVNGISATSIVVVNQHTITCNTPAFGGVFTETDEVDVGNGVIKSANVKSVTITVTNPDGSSASI